MSEHPKLDEYLDALVEVAAQAREKTYGMFADPSVIERWIRQWEPLLETSGVCLEGHDRRDDFTTSVSLLQIMVPAMMDAVLERIAGGAIAGDEAIQLAEAARLTCSGPIPARFIGHLVALIFHTGRAYEREHVLKEQEVQQP